MEPIAGRYDFIHSNDDYGQVSYLYNTVLTEDDRASLISNLVYSLGQCRKDVQDNMLRLFYKVDEDYGRRVQEGLESYFKKTTEPE
jgi:catalase